MSSESTVLAILQAAAIAGDICPTNAELCNLLGCKSVSTPARLIDNLEKSGRIIVQRFINSRVVTIVGTEYATAFTGGSIAHGRNARPIGANNEPRIDAEMQSIRRDPCSFCGVNPVVGCACKPRSQALTVLRGRPPQEIAACR